MKSISVNKMTQEYRKMTQDYEGVVPNLYSLLQMCTRYTVATEANMGGVSLATPYAYKMMMEMAEDLAVYPIDDDTQEALCSYLQRYMMTNHGSAIVEIGYAFTLLSIPFLKSVYDLYTLVRDEPGRPKQWYFDEMSREEERSLEGVDRTDYTDRPDRWEKSRDASHNIAWETNKALGLLTESKGIVTPINVSKEMMIAMTSKWSISEKEIEDAKKARRNQPTFKKLD